MHSALLFWCSLCVRQLMMIRSFPSFHLLYLRFMWWHTRQKFQRRKGEQDTNMSSDSNITSAIRATSAAAIIMAHVSQFIQMNGIFRASGMDLNLINSEMVYNIFIKTNEFTSTRAHTHMLSLSPTYFRRSLCRFTIMSGQQSDGDPLSHDRK